ncbi:unnamed protein product [Spirodela intermedia]|uniref:Uncharacterized protein n=1 Tax=Spirodela intermedia TaxID=51605 RepID=A0A7I8I8P3_SPIIN|nr:unnamed protein product [Spirodela intermedia]CAA6653432.1 unnamed protein product [Spirodela intermedia]
MVSRNPRLYALKSSCKLCLSLPSTGADRRVFAFKGTSNEFLGLRISAGSGRCQIGQRWSFMGGARAVLQRQALSFTPCRKTLFCPSASCKSSGHPPPPSVRLPGPEIAGSAFTAGTVAVLPFYALMVLAPHAKLTKRSMESGLPYVALGAAYAFLLYLSWTADTMRLMFSSKYWLPELSSITRMFSNELTMASAWLHLLLVDLFAARQIFHDGLEHKVETRHSVLLCLFFCPIGIAAHLITKLLTRMARLRLMPRPRNKLVPSLTLFIGG